MRFEPVHAGTQRHVGALYQLLAERTPEMSISHKNMPTFEEHVEFVKSYPYKAWYLCAVCGEYVGSVYLTDRNEIGIFVFKQYQGMGYGKQMIEQLFRFYRGPFFANVNPANQASKAFFEGLGAVRIQVTYEISVHRD